MASCDLAIFSTSKKEIKEQKIQKFNKQLTIRSPFGNIERLCNKVFDRFTFGLYTDVCAHVSSLFKSRQNHIEWRWKQVHGQIKDVRFKSKTGRRAVGGQETGRVCDGSVPAEAAGLSQRSS